MKNPNNCNECRYRPNKYKKGYDKHWCYWWFTEPYCNCYWYDYKKKY